MYRILEKELLMWKNKQEHLPILLRGARQVGKSFLVEKFGKAYFENIAIIDFENRPELKQPFIESREPKEILTRLEFLLDIKIKPQHTLLFLDEIQSCPDALISLRYFKEKLPDLHVIAAGSLLEFLLNDQHFSFPVGRVEFLYLKPFSFLEFLRAVSPIKAERLPSFSLLNPPSESEHRELLKLVRRYLFIGGMPAAIKAYIQEDSLQEAVRVHSRILQAYENDFGKYAKVSQYKYLQSIFRKAPTLISQVLKYSRLDPDAKAKDLKLALEALCHTQLLQKIFFSNASGLPLNAYIKEDRFKLIYLDVGLLQTTTQIDASHFFEKDILQINSGVIAEQFVGQELLAYEKPYIKSSLLFWENHPKGDAEIDYILENKGKILPIEVKAGSTGSLKSLYFFMEQKNIPLGIRISDLPLKRDKNIINIPFYLISEIDKIYLENF